LNNNIEADARFACFRVLWGTRKAWALLRWHLWFLSGN
jgi:hypothetical protein